MTSADGTVSGRSAGDALSGGGNERRWLVWARLYLGVLLFALAATFLLILAIDPFDRGTGLALLPAGIVDESPRTANVSRGRDSRFNAAIFGNSHIQLLDPARLSRLTGLSFVQLSTPGTGPREQAALLGWFIRHHTDSGALVIGVDEQWCGQDATLPLSNPFPFWLYGGETQYLANVLGSRSVAFAWRRIRLATGMAERTDPAGYWNYELGRIWAFQPPVDNRAAVDLSPRPAAKALPFPALDHIDAALGVIGTRTRVIFVMPPRHYQSLPVAHSPAADQLAACKYDLQQRASERRGALLDFLLDSPLTRKAENFWDHDHMRMNVAQMIEQRIGEQLQGFSGTENRDLGH